MASTDGAAAPAAPAAPAAAVEDDDPVIRELDVYLSTQLANELYILQFPLRPAARPYDRTNDNAPLAARFKPKVQHLELEVPLNTATNYDLAAGREYGQYYRSISAEAGGLPQGGAMRTQRLTSTVVPSKTHYALAVVKDDQLHLTPVRANLQMRPSLSYLDERDARQKEVQRHTDDEDESGGEEELKAVQVQFKRRESERAQAARKRSHAYLQKQFEEDAWVPLAYHDEQTPEADEVYGQLFAVAEDPIVLPTSRKEYLQALIPPPSTVEEHRQLSSAAGVVSMHDLQNMNLDDRVRTLLQNMQLVQFSRLRDLVLTDDIAGLLAALSKHGYLVQGNWAIRSVVDGRSEAYLEGRMALCRDYLLYLFSKERIISRREFSEATALPSDVVKDMLTQVARMRVNAGWELRLPTDDAFLAQFPEIAARQKLLLEQRYASIAKSLGLKAPKGKEREGGGGAAGAAGGRRGSVAHVAGAAGLEAAGTDAARADEAHAAMDMDAAATPTHLIPAEGATPFAQLRAFVAAVLRRHGICTAAFLQAQVDKRGAASEIVNNLLLDPATRDPDVVDTVTQALGQPFGGGLVIKRWDDGVVNAHWTALLELFGRNSTWKKSDLTAALKESLGKSYDNGAATQLLPLLCVVKRGQWALRPPADAV